MPDKGSIAEICIEFDKVSKLSVYIEIMHSQL